MWRKRYLWKDAELTVTTDKRVTVITITEAHLGISDVEHLQEHLTAVVSGSSVIILDLGSVVAMGTATVALLLDLNRSQNRAGKTLQIVGLHGKPLELIQMCRLEGLLPIQASPDVAVKKIARDCRANNEPVVICVAAAPTLSSS